MHFHITYADDHQSHAHTHTYGGAGVDHFDSQIDEAAGTDIVSATTRQLFSFDLIALAILVAVSLALPKPRICPDAHRNRPRYKLLFFRPPLRAPPL